jgi:hypothetical protein
MTGKSGQSITEHRSIPHVLGGSGKSVWLLRASDTGIRKYSYAVNTTWKAAPHAMVRARELDGSSVIGDAPNAEYYPAPASGTSCSQMRTSAYPNWKGNRESTNPRPRVWSAGLKWVTLSFFFAILGTSIAYGEVLVSSPGQIESFTGSSVVAYSSPTGLIASTGNLYWTSKVYNEFGPDISVVWRAGKNNVPGNEVALYTENGDDRYFGDIVYANPGAFYGYFVATYQTAGVLSSQIKRVPLTGGPAVVIANCPAPIARDLVTDGTRLFWVDSGGIRSVPLGGGPITTLRGEGSFITHIRLDSSYIYFSEEFLILRMPKSGGLERVVISTSGIVTALHVDGSIGQVFWGEQGGGVFSTASNQVQGTRLTFQTPSAGRTVTSVGWDGSRVLWSDCLQPGNTNGTIKEREGGITRVVASGQVGVGHLQWDAASIYWGDVSYLRRYVR